MRVRFRVKVCILSVLTGLLTLSSIAQTHGPAAPSKLTATPGNHEVILRWSDNTVATSYRLKRAIASGGPYTQIATTTFAGYTDVGRTNGITYFYAVSAVDAAGEGANSPAVSAKPSASAPTKGPGAPAKLTATPGNREVILRWSDAAGATSYHLKRATVSGGPYTQIATTNFAGYTDVGRTNEVTYFYTVSAVDAAGEGANSAQVSAKPAAPAASPAVTSVEISPSSAASITSGTLPFSATVAGTTSNKGVTWKASRGKITSSGTYTAPSSSGTDTVTATSTADSTKWASASVKVTVATAPPPTPAPPPAAPPAGSGLSLDFFSQSVSEIQASHFPSVPFGGVRLWDTNTSWDQIETSRGTYTWTELDAWLLSTSSHGKDSMYTFGRVPHWASMRPSEACPYNPSSEGCAAPPADVDSGDNTWKTFVTELVHHSMSSPNLHIAYYEMWNEPDLKRNWTGTPAQLVTMVRDAYAIIHELDPNAKVVGPSPSTANQYGVHFLPDYYAAGGSVAQDIVGLHAYLYTGSNFSTTPAAITTSIIQLQDLMAKYHIGSKPIWFTEGNWNADGNGSLTDAQKAAYLAQEYMLMWSSGAVARYYWYSWDSSVGTLWTSSKGLNPAGTAYSLLARWLVGSTHSANPCSEGSDGTWTCALTLSTGYPAEIIWNPTVSKNITVSPAFATDETLANSSVHSIAGNTVTIGSLPILIVKSQAIQ